MEIDPGLASGLGLLAIAVLWLWCFAWAVRDAQRRGFGGCLTLLLFLGLGPVAAALWFVVRPKKTLALKSPADYTDPDDALSDAAKLDALGEWDKAVVLYQSTAERWPEHAGYVANCVAEIMKKRENAGG